VFWTATNAAEPMLLYLVFISQDWSTYKGGVQWLLIGRGAALHAAQCTMIRKIRSARVSRLLNAVMAAPQARIGATHTTLS
jgi:hypothetical protein